VQTNPAPPANQGQIADVCNQPAIVDGVSVVAYWSRADNLCIVPTSGVRSVSSLTYTVTEVARKDGPVRQAYVDLGALCGAAYFDYHERTYQNLIIVRASLSGYESPIVVWMINGQVVPHLPSSVEVNAEWQLPPASKYAPFLINRKATAKLLTSRLSPSAPEMTIGVGPDEGSIKIGVTCSVFESFDSSKPDGNEAGAGTGSTIRNASILVEAKNQELVWGEAYQQAKKNCDHIRHLSAGGGGGIVGPLPGDPPDLAQILSRLINDTGPEQTSSIRRAAELIRNFSTDVADALISHAERKNRDPFQG
jgi:hypothetical protein